MKRKVVFAFVTIIFVSIFAFGQTGRQKANWKNVATAMAVEVDKTVVAVETLESIIQTQISNPFPCDRKMDFYNSALENLSEARSNFQAAYAACQKLANAKTDSAGKILFLSALSEYAKATEAFKEALYDFYNAVWAIC